jgi:hypothetical protein
MLNLQGNQELIMICGYFLIESNGEIKEFEIKERAKSSFGKLMGIPLGTTYLPVKMEGFTGSKKY